MKNQNGVTIMALVLTVIVMLILASVSVRMLVSDKDSALNAANQLKNSTNTTLYQHSDEISDIVNEIKGTNIN